MLDGHVCSMYCGDGEHCDLVYAGVADAGKIAQVYGYYRGLVVTRVETATEAPPPDAAGPNLDRIAGSETVDNHRLLVWWRE